LGREEEIGEEEIERVGEEEEPKLSFVEVEADQGRRREREWTEEKGRG